MFESEPIDHNMHGMPVRGRNLTDPDLLLHMLSPSGSTPSSTVRSTVPRRPHLEPSDFTMPLIPTIRADSPMSAHSRDPPRGDDLEPPKLWKTPSRGSQPNSPSASACPSPTPSAAPSSYSVRLKTSSGGGEPTGARLQRKKSNASLLMKRGLSRMGSVMGGRKGASTGGGKEGSRHGQQNSTGTPERRRIPRNNSFTLDDLVEETGPSPCTPTRSGQIRVHNPMQPLLPSQICQAKAEISGSVSRPFNVQHQLHVTESLEGLPTEWLEQLKTQGLSDTDLTLIMASQRKQRSVALHPIAMQHAARRDVVRDLALDDFPARSPVQLTPKVAHPTEGTYSEGISTQRQERPKLAPSAELRRLPKQKPSLTIQVPPRERPTFELEQGHVSPPEQHRALGATAASTAAGSTSTWPRAASTAAPSDHTVPVLISAAAPASPAKPGPDPTHSPEAAARSPTSTSLPTTPTSTSGASKTRRRSRALSTQLKRSSSIITKLLSDLDHGSSRSSRQSSQYLRPRSRTENASGSDTDDRRGPSSRRMKYDQERGARHPSATSWLSFGDAPASSTRRLSDEIRGFQNLSIGVTDGDEWAASILAAWDEEDRPEALPAEEGTAPAPHQESSVDPEGDCAPEEAEIRVVKRPITKQASLISLRALMEDAEERQGRPRPKSVFMDRVYSPPPPLRPMRVASPTSRLSPPSEPRLEVPTMSSSRSRCISVDSFGVQRPHSQTSTTSPSSSELDLDLNTPPLDENATTIIALPKRMTQPLRLVSPRASSTPPLHILRSPRSDSSPLNRSSSRQSLDADIHRSRPSSQLSRQDEHESSSVIPPNHPRLTLQPKPVRSTDSVSSLRSPQRYSPVESSFSSSISSSIRHDVPPPSRATPDVPRSNTDTIEGTTSTPGAPTFPSSGSFLPFGEEEIPSPAEAYAVDHRAESFSLPTSAESQSIEYASQLPGREHIRGQESIQSIESLFAPSGALGLVLNLDGVNSRLSDGGTALSRASSCSSAHYSYQLHEVTVQRAYTRVLRRAGESVHDLGGDIAEVSSESACGEEAYMRFHGSRDEHVLGHRATPSGPTGVTPVDGMFSNARLLCVNGELDDVADGYHTAFASPRFDTNRMSGISSYSGSVYHTVSSSIEPHFTSSTQSKRPPPPPLPSQMLQLQAQLRPQRI